MTRVAASLALLLVAATASADVAPPPGYAGSCTVEKQQKKGEECTSCSAWHGERDKCQKELGAQGYTQRCKTRGASVWSEVWCKASEPKKDGAKPAPEKKSSTEVDLPKGRPVQAPWFGFAFGALAALGAVFATWRYSTKA